MQLFNEDIIYISLINKIIFLINKYIVFNLKNINHNIFLNINNYKFYIINKNLIKIIFFYKNWQGFFRI